MVKAGLAVPNNGCQGGVGRGLGQGPVLPWRPYRLHVESVLKRPDDWGKTNRRLGLRHTDNANITTHRGDGRANMEQHSEGLKVMVIDDSKTIRRTADTLLKKSGL